MDTQRLLSALFHNAPVQLTATDDHERRLFREIDRTCETTDLTFVRANAADGPGVSVVGEFTCRPLDIECYESVIDFLCAAVVPRIGDDLCELAWRGNVNGMPQDHSRVDLTRLDGFLKICPTVIDMAWRKMTPEDEPIAHDTDSAVITFQIASRATGEEGMPEHEALRYAPGSLQVRLHKGTQVVFTRKNDDAIVCALGLRVSVAAIDPKSMVRYVRCHADDLCD